MPSSYRTLTKIPLYHNDGSDKSHHRYSMESGNDKTKKGKPTSPTRGRVTTCTSLSNGGKVGASTRASQVSESELRQLSTVATGCALSKGSELVSCLQWLLLMSVFLPY